MSKSRKVIFEDKLSDSFAIDRNGVVWLHLDPSTLSLGTNKEVTVIGSKYTITGTGRPDRPATTGGKIKGTELNGTQYISTDGGGVNAWVWIKTNGSWSVIKGDTGWMTLPTTGIRAGRVEIRRTEQGAFIRALGWNYESISLNVIAVGARTNLSGTLPVGFESTLGAWGFVTNDYNKGTVGVFMLSAKNDGNNKLQFRCSGSYSTSDYLRPQELRYIPDDVWVNSLTI